jgi:capsular exopolysaccharide synthesis family protein
MSFFSVLSKEASKVADEGYGKEHQFAGQCKALVSLRADPAYPLVIDPEQSAAVQHFGVIRTRLLNAHIRSGIRSVVITSPQKEEGKSLTCVNLAISVAQLGKYRVLLVDGDLRVKGVTQLLGLQEDLGLGDFLQGKTAFESVLCPTDLPFLTVAGAGNVSDEALPAVLEGTKWPDFLQQAKERFELIIVDSVPVVAPIADFELLSAACDGALLIVQLHKTRREALDLTLRRLDGKLTGVVINDTEPPVGSDYYSYYYGKKR